MSHKMYLKYGPLMAEWEEDDSLRLTRDDVPQHIVLTFTEWGMVLAMASLHGWPIAPPLSVLQEQGIVPCTRPTEIETRRKK